MGLSDGLSVGPSDGVVLGTSVGASDGLSDGLSVGLSDEATDGNTDVVAPPTPPRCGCDWCTKEIRNTLADGHTCGGRFSFLRDSDVDALQNVGINDGCTL